VQRSHDFQGILRADDAVLAAAAGAAAIWISNHGGRQLDYTPAAIDVLPAILDAVGDRAEVETFLHSLPYILSVLMVFMK